VLCAMLLSTVCSVPIRNGGGEPSEDPDLSDGGGDIAVELIQAPQPAVVKTQLPIADVNQDLLPTAQDWPLNSKSINPGSPSKPNRHINSSINVNPVIIPNKPNPLVPPVVRLPAEECFTKDDEIGECLSAYDCGITNGQIKGLCHQGLDQAAYTRVCCIYSSQCGYSTSKPVSYFQSPAWPALVTNHSACNLEVNLNPGVCQVRLDFLDFHLGSMEEGICSPYNSMTIKSTVRHAYIPVDSLCGNLSPRNPEQVDHLQTDTPHLYIHVEELPVDRVVPKLPNRPSPSISLNVRVNNFPSKWNIRVSQIQCDGAPLQAPAGCAQYYNSLSGTMSSLNINDKQYMTNMNMDACIKLDQQACAIKYHIDHMNVGSVRGNKLGYGLTCDDFISFNGEKTSICGAVANKEMILPVTGSQGLTLHSDTKYSKNEVGFKIKYSYVRDLRKCKEVAFFRYPQLK